MLLLFLSAFLVEWLVETGGVDVRDVDWVYHQSHVDQRTTNFPEPGDQSCPGAREYNYLSTITGSTDLVMTGGVDINAQYQRDSWVFHTDSPSWTPAQPVPGTMTIDLLHPQGGPSEISNYAFLHVSNFDGDNCGIMVWDHLATQWRDTTQNQFANRWDAWMAMVWKKKDADGFYVTGGRVDAMTHLGEFNFVDVTVTPTPEGNWAPLQPTSGLSSVWRMFSATWSDDTYDPQRLYMLGGTGSTGRVGELRYLDIGTRSLTWELVHDLSSSPATNDPTYGSTPYFGARDNTDAVLIDGDAYVFGGQSDDWESGNSHLVSSVWKFVMGEFSANQGDDAGVYWVSGIAETDDDSGDIAANYDGGANAMTPGTRYVGYSVVSLDGKLWVFGGNSDVDSVALHGDIWSVQLGAVPPDPCGGVVPGSSPAGEVLEMGICNLPDSASARVLFDAGAGLSDCQLFIPSSDPSLGGCTLGDFSSGSSAFDTYFYVDVSANALISCAGDGESDAFSVLDESVPAPGQYRYTAKINGGLWEVVCNGGDFVEQFQLEFLVPKSGEARVEARIFDAVHSLDDATIDSIISAEAAAGYGSGGGLFEENSLARVILTRVSDASCSTVSLTGVYMGSASGSLRYPPSSDTYFDAGNVECYETTTTTTTACSFAEGDTDAIDIEVLLPFVGTDDEHGEADSSSNPERIPHNAASFNLLMIEFTVTPATTCSRRSLKKKKKPYQGVVDVPVRLVPRGFLAEEREDKNKLELAAVLGVVLTGVVIVLLALLGAMLVCSCRKGRKVQMTIKQHQYSVLPTHDN